MPDLGISWRNYLLLSATNFTHEGKSRPVGFGTQSNVFSSSKLNNSGQQWRFICPIAAKRPTNRTGALGGAQQ
jgi:hypothetical protein